MGTFAGLGLTWLLLSGAPLALTICLIIFVLHFVVEMLVVRHYGLAVFFITHSPFFWQRQAVRSAPIPTA